MTIYHASNTEVPFPDTLHSRDFLDFGKGFYVTTIREQAERYAQRFLRRGQAAWLNIYELSEDHSDWNVKYFDSYDSQWLDYVAACRIGKPVEKYDLIIGGIANDRVIITIDRYFAGELSKEQTLGVLKYEKPNIQYCFCSDKMLNDCVTFIKSIRL